MLDVRADLFIATDIEIATIGSIRYDIPAKGGVPAAYRVSFPIQVSDGRDEPAAVELMNYFGPFVMALSLLNRPENTTKRLPSQPGEPPVNEIVFDARTVGQRKESN